MIFKIDNIHAKTEEKNILKGLSLEVKKAEVHSIMGPNGSGKSTLSKVIAGHPTYTVTKGQILVTDSFKQIDLLSLTPDERAKSGVFIAFQYPVELPGVSNFTFLKAIFNANCKAKGAPIMDAIDFKELLTKYLEFLDIKESFLERSVNQDFSGGEKKRNEILQMLLLKPKIVFLDEIDSGLDVDSLQLVSKAINHLKNETSFVIITHYNRILNYVKPDYVHIMKDGFIKKSGDISLAEDIESRGYEWI
jgi:Fe-S cluster assembly ATP-binding protein